MDVNFMLSITSHKQAKAQSCLAVEVNFDPPATDEPWVRAQIYFYYLTQAPIPSIFINSQTPSRPASFICSAFACNDLKRPFPDLPRPTHRP
jgi:hypothetical protein